MQINLPQKVFYLLFFFLIIFSKNFSFAESRFGELTEMFDDKMRGTFKRLVRSADAVRHVTESSLAMDRRRLRRGPGADDALSAAWRIDFVSWPRSRWDDVNANATKHYEREEGVL